MNRTGLIFRNLWFFRKPWLGILAGVVISTAVLTGSLIVGDSVRFSLQQLTVKRLGKIRFALQPGDRFFRQDLAWELSVKTGMNIAPVMQSEGIAINSDKNSRINRVQVVGIDDRFNRLWDQCPVSLREDGAILSRNAAAKLGLKTGDAILIRINKPGKASQNAPFVSEKYSSVSQRFTVTAIADDRQSGRFSLKSNQSAPYNVFVSLKQMARVLDLGGLANLLLVGESGKMYTDLENLNIFLRQTWTIQDAGLNINISGKGKGDTSAAEVFRITSDRIFIGDTMAQAIKSTLPGSEGILTYMVNSISFRGRSTPYSFVTAMDDALLNQHLTGNEILINKWLSDDLGASTGDSIKLRYFIVGNTRTLKEDSSVFIIKKVLSMQDPLCDPALMPDFPGMADAGNCRDWETGAPVDLKRIRIKDEQYWNQYRGTPKGFIALKTGQKIWNNPFGTHTAIRFIDQPSALPKIRKSIMDKLDPAVSGMIFRPVFVEGTAAASNSTDFGMLFLSLGFFIILAALLLSSLLFSLHVTTRMRETGILTMLGFRKKQIGSLLFTEAAIIVILGGILGSIAGIGCNGLLLLGLNTLWQDAVRTSALEMHLNPVTLLAGALSGITMTMLVLFLTLRRVLRKSISEQVRGISSQSLKGNLSHKRIIGFIALFFALVALGMIALSFLLIPEANPGLFMLYGFSLLLGGVIGLYYFLWHLSETPGNGLPKFFKTIFKNAALNRNRTMAAVTLLALGTFSIIITGANRKTIGPEFANPQSGTGGFLLWAETTIPIRVDLNSKEGQRKSGLADEAELNGVHYFQIKQMDGDDASCLNLNQVSQPKLQAIDAAYLDKLKSFSFINFDPVVDQKHPWNALNHNLSPGVIPAFADQTVITWGLRKKIGDTLTYRTESGKILYLRLMGGLDNSIFQGNMLISDTLFRNYYPSVNGSRIILVNGPAGKQEIIANRLEHLFQDQGMMVSPTTERLATFNSVENTYISVFMFLGAFGVILGTFGLGIILLRNIHERRQELALYLALGFPKKFILKLLVTEHVFILISGIILGFIPALAGILPSLVSPAFHFPYTYILTTLFLILLSGVLWIFFPVRSILKKEIIPVLKNE
ncbi:MAG: ABC transporter permease [Bacteroidales bacterium]|jgi:ABC-type antimicrobial peptide transport system permease subunit|nr:ABC transporter permease [Bacteroidales bacterium]